MWSTNTRWQLLPLLLTLLALVLGTVVILRRDTTPTVTPVTPTAEATVTIAGIPVRPLLVKPAQPPPVGTDLLVATGCFGCGWPATQLLLIHRPPAGDSTVRALLQAGGGFDGITGVATSAKGAIAVSTCVGASCEAPGMRPEAGRTVIRRSLDGGTTWEPPVELAGFAWVHAFAHDQVIVSRLYQAPQSTRWVTEVLLEPSGTVLLAPAGSFPSGRPHALASGEILWVNQRQDAFLDASSAAFIRPAMSDGAVVEEIARGTANELLVSWYQVADGSSSTAHYVGRYRPDGSPIAIYAVPPARGLERWSGPAIEVAPVNWPEGSEESLPGLIDATAGTITPVGGPLLDPEFAGGSYQLWLLPG